MIIKKLSATFGCLNNAELTLDDGFNMIVSANESGKSTWCAFIRAMLYGVDSSERSKGGALTIKQKYAPWSGAPMEGTMELISGGRDITLRRMTASPSAPMREFSAVYSDSGESVPAMTGADAGEMLTGVKADVLRRSAFISQGELAVSNSEELEKRIEQVVTSGEEGVSYKEADNRLRSWQRRRRYNNRGAIPELDSYISERREVLEDLDGAGREQRRLSEELDSCVQEAGNLSEERERFKSEYNVETASILSQARAGETKAQKEYTDAQVALAEKKQALNEGAFAGMAAADAQRVAQSDAEQAVRAGKGIRNSLLWLTLVLDILTVGSAAAGFFYMREFYYACAGFGLLTLIMFVINILRIAKNRRLDAEREAILEKYDVESEEDILRASKFYAKRRDAFDAAKAREAETRAALEKAAAEARSAEERMLKGPEEELERRFGSAERAAAGRQAVLQSRLSELTGRARAMGDPEELRRDIREHTVRRSELAGQYDAIETAVAALKGADEEIRARFSPEVAKKAAEYMSRMTGGRYCDISLTREFTAETRLTGDSVSRPSGYMSQGAADLMYLAVRLAVCDAVLPKEDLCPIVLDDALVNLDPERREGAVSLLKEIGETRQVILFACS